MPLFNLICLGFGWPWVGEFVGFTLNTNTGKSQTPFLMPPPFLLSQLELGQTFFFRLGFFKVGSPKMGDHSAPVKSKKAKSAVVFV